ncbi:MAG: NmrA family NAD(P)-binding protein [Cytophagales bacterium]|jgi:uncharacterized protein YbjT (DUF2867 family)|nr:NmrA family NAD(P)-binding protein [Cytophagales bacterium]
MYVITGATGNTGKRIVENLLKAGEPVTAVGRSAEKLQPLADRGAKTAVGDLNDAAFLTETFRGATAVYAMIPPNAAAPDFRAYQNEIGLAIIEAAKNSGVQSVVTLSSFGAHSPQTGVVAGLYDFETNFKKVAEANVLHLRAGFFMQNFFGNIGLIKGMGINGGFPINGDVKMPMVHTDDIADVATEHLLKRDFSGQTYLYLANADLTMVEATQILGNAIEKPDLQWVTFPYDQAKGGMMQMGFSESLADAYIQFGRATNEGIMYIGYERQPEHKTSTSLATFAEREFAAAFQHAEMAPAH